MTRRTNPRQVQQGRSRCQTGFSLLELLVVIAMIGVLISIMLPAVGRTHDRANLTLCKGHLRNIGVGVLRYADNSDGCLPVDEKLDNPHTGLIAALSGPGYVDHPESYYCPSEWKPELSFSDANVRAANIGYFYYGCEQATTNRRVSTFLRWEVRWPRRLTTDTHPQTWVMSDSWFSGEPTSHAAYKKGVNFLTVDGSVRMIQKSPRRQFK